MHILSQRVQRVAFAIKHNSHKTLQHRLYILMRAWFTYATKHLYREATSPTPPPHTPSCRPHRAFPGRHEWWWCGGLFNTEWRARTLHHGPHTLAQKAPRMQSDQRKKKHHFTPTMCLQWRWWNESILFRRRRSANYVDWTEEETCCLCSIPIVRCCGLMHRRAIQALWRCCADELNLDWKSFAGGVKIFVRREMNLLELVDN